MSGGGNERSPESENTNNSNLAIKNHRNDRKKEKLHTQETSSAEQFPKNQYHNKP
jgi:hypothetical protein